MNVVLRTPTAVLDSFDSSTVSEFAVVTDAFVVNRFADLVMVHLGACRVYVKTAKHKHDYFSENLFAYTSAGGTLFIFMDDSYVPFEQAWAELPTHKKGALHRMTEGMTIDALSSLHGNYGAINLANAIEQTGWRQVLEIYNRFSPKEG